MTAGNQNSGVKVLPFKILFIIKMAAVVIILNSPTLYVNLLFYQNFSGFLFNEKTKFVNVKQNQEDYAQIKLSFYKILLKVYDI